MKKIIFFLLILPSIVFGQSTGKIINNKAGGGTIIADTLTLYSRLNLAQTTAGQTITIANRTGGGYECFIANIGSTAVTMSPGGSLPVGNEIRYRWTGSAWTPSASYSSGSGTVTSVSVISANGFNGSVATATSTPAITIGTSITGLLKGNGTSISSATSGTDYATPATISADGTDANYTAVVNSVKYLPASTLTANRTITIPTGSNGDFLEIYNNETSFSWLLSGASVYLSDGTTVVTSLYANTNHLIRKVSGRWRILN